MLLTYSAEALAALDREYAAVQSDLDALFLAAVRCGQDLTDLRAKQHMLHGAGRRLKVLKRCLTNVFALFPPATKAPLASEDLHDAEISLHAFVMNLYGFFENLAWTFVIFHALETQVGGYRGTGMFLKSTQKYLPSVLRDYLVSSTMVTWQTDYLKNYRDSLAHRIPLYIPPATYTPEESEKYKELDREELESMRLRQWERYDAARAAKASLGSACSVFVHSFTERDEDRPLVLHTQMLCDIKSVIEFGGLYFAHWRERAGL